jgi:hypothetical protein
MAKRILIGVIILLVIVQFIQPPHNNAPADTPTDITHAVAVPADVMTVLKKSCYDCHSNHTDYPWYSKITPVNWWLNNHINEGKRELNFSEFATYTERKKSKKLEETAKQVEKKEMPLSSYTLIHTDAKLTDAQRQLVINWAKSVNPTPGAGESSEKERD